MIDGENIVPRVTMTVCVPLVLLPLLPPLLPFRATFSPARRLCPPFRFPLKRLP